MLKNSLKFGKKSGQNPGFLREIRVSGPSDILAGFAEKVWPIWQT